MPSNFTEHYQLNQWEAGDRVLRTDFNADNAKIDAAIAAVERRADGLEERKADKTALAAKTEIVAGTYTGSGAVSQTISLGFTPKAVYVTRQSGVTNYVSTDSSYYGGLALTDSPVRNSKSGVSYTILEIVSGGFRVFYQSIARSNQAGEVYYYLAFT